MPAWMVVAGVPIQHPFADAETSGPITVACDEDSLAQLVKMRRSRIGDADGVEYTGMSAMSWAQLDPSTYQGTFASY